MPSPALDLSLAPQDDAAVRRLWATLQVARLPSRGDHRSPSNRPHVTLTTSPALTAAHLPGTTADLKRLLPCQTHITGLTQLGLYLCLAVEFDAEWRQQVAALRRACNDPRATLPWIPHITLSGRLTEAEVARAREVLVDVPRTVVLERITYWDPAAGQVVEI